MPRTERRRLLRPSTFVLAAVLVALAIGAWFWFFRDSSVQAVTAWSLTGVWQRDCEAPVRANNPRYTYSVEDGKILLKRDFGGTSKDASVISDAERLPSGELRYVVHFSQLGEGRRDRATRQNILTKSPDGRIRTLGNKDMRTGEESVVGGVRVADRIPTPWMERCRSQ